MLRRLQQICQAVCGLEGHAILLALGRLLQQRLCSIRLCPYLLQLEVPLQAHAAAAAVAAGNVGAQLLGSFCVIVSRGNTAALHSTM